MKKMLMVLMLGAGMLLAGLQVQAEEMQGMEHTQGATQADAGQVHRGHGVVNKVNAQAGKVNITHEPIDSMGWPKMTMDFSVQDKTVLENIKPGMKVDFELTVKGRGYRITHIAPAK